MHSEIKLENIFLSYRVTFREQQLARTFMNVQVVLLRGS